MAHGSPDYTVGTVTAGGGAVIQPQRTGYNREASIMTAGEVVINDSGATVQGMKYTVAANNPHAAGVVADTIQPGALGNFYYHGVAIVNVIGAGAVGDALVTSTTSGAAKSNGRTKIQMGFIGYALDSWAGPGQVLAFLDIAEDYYGAEAKYQDSKVAFNTGTFSITTTTTLNSGVEPNRIIIAFVGASMGTGAGTITPATPTVGGSNMTQIGSTYTTWGENGVNTWRAYKFINPPSNVALAISTGAWAFTDGTGNTVQLICFALSGVEQTTGVRTLNVAIGASSSPWVQATDAAVGDTIVSCLMDKNNVDRGYLVTAVPADQTLRTQNIITGVNADQQGYACTEVAQSQTEQTSFTLNAAVTTIVAQLPVIPA